MDRYAYKQITSPEPTYDAITSVMTKTGKGKIIAKQATEVCKDNTIMISLMFDDETKPQFNKNDDYSTNLFDDSDIS